MRAILVLEDGTVFEGESLGAPGRTYGEVVFNTGMTGYQEILTDPSYAGQIVTLTYPLAGNYGINLDDFESRRVQVDGFVVREAADVPSNWRSERSLHTFLKDRRIVGIQGVDTRALTRALRVRGVMMGAISTEETPEQILSRLKTAPPYGATDYNRVVTTERPYVWPPYTASLTAHAVDGKDRDLSMGEPPRVALLDCGVKYNIMR